MLFQWTVPGLNETPGIHALFLARAEGVDVETDRETALGRLTFLHREAIHEAGLGSFSLVTANQVHGSVVKMVDDADIFDPPEADGLVTNRPGLALGVYVADCAAVYLFDRATRSIGLIHSGRKGTGQNIVRNAVNALQDGFGVRPADLLAVVSPCIRPPHYEVDFAAGIRSQLSSCGVGEVIDTGCCTASDPTRFYSYRREKGKTGRMLAILALDEMSHRGQNEI